MKPAIGGHEQNNTEAFRREFALAISRGPLFGLVAASGTAKGNRPRTISRRKHRCCRRSSVSYGKGRSTFRASTNACSERFPGQVAVRIGFDEGTARRIFAGSDFILMPSRYEPCGLSQMHAQRFGALPIGRETGVSADHTGWADRLPFSTGVDRTIPSSHWPHVWL